MKSVTLNGKILVNATPHDINLYLEDNNMIVIPKNDFIARVSSTEVAIDDLFSKIQYGTVDGLPDPQDNTYYIVSGLVMGATDRIDVIQPNTTRAIRNEHNQIIGVSGFITK